MSSARWALPGLVLAATLAASDATPAKEATHTVVAGESASSLAKKYYGDADLGDALLRYNERPGKVIHPGERLLIPSCDVRKIRAGDTWSALAKRYLGRVSASAVLAELNGAAADAPLRVGEPVVVPVVLRHTLARGETLASLAERFYGDPRKAKTLQSFGRLEDAKRLSVGTVVEIPLVRFRRRAADPVPVIAAAEPKKAPAEERRFAVPLAEAERRFEDGDYDRAREILEGMRDAVAAQGAGEERSELGRLLAFVYIAMERDADACVAYETVTPASRERSLDPDRISPRIRDALAKCSVADPVGRGLDTPASAAHIAPHADPNR